MNQVWVSIVAIVISKGVHKVVQHLMFTCEQVTRSVTEFQGSPVFDFLASKSRDCHRVVATLETHFPCDARATLPCL
jgi:hypothetical protein